MSAYKARNHYKESHFHIPVNKNNSLTNFFGNSAVYYQKPIKNRFRSFNQQLFAALVVIAVILPTLKVEAGTYYLDDKAISKQVRLEQQLKNTGLVSTQLVQRKKWLTPWLVGSGLGTLIVGIGIAIRAKRKHISKAINTEEVSVATSTSEIIDSVNSSQKSPDCKAKTALIVAQSEIQNSFLQDTVAEARNHLNCDRVLIYSLNQDNYGTVIAESVAPDFTPALGKIIQDPCFESRYLDKYRNGRIQVIDNVGTVKMTSCHLEQLEQLEIKANLVVPIVHRDRDKLFGLLVANQCSEPRHWKTIEIELLKQIAGKISLTFHNDKLLSNVSYFEHLALKEREWTNCFTDTVQYIRKSLVQEDILNITVEEVRRVLECDRVLVYSLNQDNYGTVIAESVVPGFTKALNQVISDPCFEARYLEKYRGGRVRALNNIHEAGIPKCYLEQLESLDVKANLVTPILNEGKIFGLLVAHQCGMPRNWQESEIRWLTQIATQVGFALDNAKVLALANEKEALAKIEREWTNYFTDAVQYIRQSLKQEDILDISVEEVRRVLRCDRVLVYSLNQDNYGTVIAESLTAGYTRALNQVISDPCFEARYLEKYRDGRVRALNNIYEAGIPSCYLEQLESLDVKANLVTPILNEGKIFGLLVAHQCGMPRNWQEYEIRWVTQISTQVGFALDNAKVLRELRDQNTSSQLLNSFTFNLHNCLNLSELLKNTVEQVGKALKLDRTVVYQFDLDWNGIIVAESVAPGYPRALNSQIKDPCFVGEYGEKYRQGYTNAIADIHQANLSECYLEKLDYLAVKAAIIAPVLRNNKLFGLLIGHQCSEPRSWKPSEVELLAQLAFQLGLALEQVQLKEELSHQQNIRENEINQNQPKQADFPKKISELQKISKLLLENQTTLQKLKAKINDQSANTNDLINQIQDINYKSLTTYTDYPKNNLQLKGKNHAERQEDNQLAEEKDLTLIEKPIPETQNNTTLLNNSQNRNFFRDNNNL